MPVGTLFIVVGPPGAGKSTEARRWRLRTGGLFLEMDTFIRKGPCDMDQNSSFTHDAEESATSGRDTDHVPTALLTDDHPEFVARYGREAVHALRIMKPTALEALRRGQDVALEFGLMVRRARRALYAWCRREGIRCHVVLVDASPLLRRKRVEERNRIGAGLRLSGSTLDAIDALWEEPDESELPADCRLITVHDFLEASRPMSKDEERPDAPASGLG